MSIAVRKISQVYADDHAWVYADISQQAGRASVSLDMTKFTKATHFPKGFIPSGVPLGRITATKLYGPYDNTATDGREVLAGHLWAYVTVEADATEIATEPAALWVGPGIIQEDKLDFPVDAAGKTDVAAWFKYSTQL